MSVPATKTVIVFDVNETLLDLMALGSRFEAVLPGELMSLWFARMLFNSSVSTMTGVYRSFEEQGIDALTDTGRRIGIEVSIEEARSVIDGMRELPPHRDVVPALEALQADGFRMATLTNGSTSMVRDQIHNAGLDPYFEQLLSVEAVGEFKPSPRVYRYAAEAMGVEIGRIRLVAAHAWDVTGAIRAGARAAFIARGGAELGRLSETPDVVAPDLVRAASAMISE